MGRISVKQPEAAAAAIGWPVEAGTGLLSVPYVPRIGIHAFFVAEATGHSLEAASRDRRMSRATVKIRSGGVAAAISAYASSETPELIILEVGAKDDFLARLDELASVCDLGTKLVVIGDRGDIEFYRELTKRGISEYLQCPVSDADIISAVAGLYSDQSSKKLGRICAFIGAKGGVGSSTVAQNVASAISARQDAGAILVDMDLAFGTAALNYNVEPAHGIAEAMGDIARLDDVMLERLLTKSGERLAILSAPAMLEKECDFAADAFDRLVELAQSMAPYIILDLPHTWTGWSRKMLMNADEVVITAAPDLASLRNAKHLAENLRSARPNDAPPKLVLNQVNMPNRPEIKPREFAEVLSIEPSAVIAFEPKLFGKAAISGTMVTGRRVRGAASRSLAQLAQDISGRTPRRKSWLGLPRLLPGLRRAAG